MTRLTAIDIRKQAVYFILGSLFLFLMSYILGLNLAIPCVFIVLLLYLSLRKQFYRQYNPLYITFLFVIILTLSYLIIKHGGNVFYIPYCAVPMLVTLLFGELELSLLISLISALTISAFSPSYTLYVCYLFLASGILSSILVFGARRRIAVIQAGVVVGIAQALIFFFLENFKAFASDTYVILFLNGVLSSVLVVGILPIFESLFKTATNVSLLELADFHNPLLQRMILEAPGTYHHSLVVGNLSDAACTAIGANALLARIGAYYHDIGKLAKPEYFSENQSIKENKHDNLAPTMSKLVIMNHVKEGVELAYKYRLNPVLINFIQQHHGSSLVYYFYRRALENLEEDQAIKEEGFRYPGPKPRSKETAVVLLADSVEAAMRSLREPNAEKIKEVVHKIINNKFIDGQLDECDLTLRDMEKISDVFIRILGGIYHSRIFYPENQDSPGQETRENNNKKPSV